MKKLSRTIVCIVLAILGTDIVLFSSSALLQGVDFVMAIVYLSLLVIGMGFVAVGWAVMSGESIKDMVRYLFSDISF